MLKQMRRISARKRLEAQLASGVKTKKGTVNEKEPLSDKDIKRIEKEIAILKSKG